MDRSADHHFHLSLESVPLERREPSIDSAPVRALQKADCTSKFRFFEYPCHFELSTKHGINGKTKITCHGNVPYILLEVASYGRFGQNPRTCQPYPPQKATEGRCVWQVIFGFVLQGEVCPKSTSSANSTPSRALQEAN